MNALIVIGIVAVIVIVAVASMYNGLVKLRNNRENAFANIDVLPAQNVAVGVEYRQGIDAGDGIENADYWEGHVAWFVNDRLTLVGAYVNTGNKNKGFDPLGLGDGFVLSVQYQF